MDTIQVTCPKCRKTEQIRIDHPHIRRELTINGYTALSFYHTNHALYVVIGRNSIAHVDVFDPPSTLVYGSNIISNGFLILRNPIVPAPMDILLLDIKNNIIDARFVSNHMHAIIFAKYASNALQNHISDEIINALGVNYHVTRNSEFLVATIIKKDDKTRISKISKRILQQLRSFPPEINLVLSVFGRNAK